MYSVVAYGNSRRGYLPKSRSSQISNSIYFLKYSAPDWLTMYTGQTLKPDSAIFASIQRVNYFIVSVIFVGDPIWTVYNKHLN